LGRPTVVNPSESSTIPAGGGALAGPRLDWKLAMSARQAKIASPMAVLSASCM
jgi:hypothetical protein